MIKTVSLLLLNQRLQARNGGGVGFAFLADHPATAMRIAALRTGTAGAPSMTPTAWNALKAVCD